MLPKLKVYEYSGCSTCKKALKLLDSRGVRYEKIAIVETPPSTKELRAMAARLPGGFRKLFNTSGQLYREMKIGDRLKAGHPDPLSEDEAIQLLSRHGKLVKRPFICGPDRGIVGFDEAALKKL